MVVLGCGATCGGQSAGRRPGGCGCRRRAVAGRGSLPVRFDNMQSAVVRHTAGGRDVLPREVAERNCLPREDGFLRYGGDQCVPAGACRGRLYARTGVRLVQRRVGDAGPQRRYAQAFPHVYTTLCGPIGKAWNQVRIRQEQFHRAGRVRRWLCVGGRA